MARVLGFIIILLAVARVSAAGEVDIIRDRAAVRKNVKSWLESKNENLARQEHDYSCGSAALATILKFYFNEQVSEKEILSRLLAERGIGKKEKMTRHDFALSFHDLGKYAQTLGYRPVGLALPFDSLKELKVPAIIYLKIRNYVHFTVYRGMDEEHVYLADPSFGNIKYRIGKFRDMFGTRSDTDHSGRILVLIPSSEEKKNNVNKQFMLSAGGYDYVDEIIKSKASSLFIF